MIRCEGGKVDFKNAEHRLLFINSYCSSVLGWKSCSVAQGLLKFYEKEELYGIQGKSKI